jgi:hypothetical protein
MVQSFEILPHTDRLSVHAGQSVKAAFTLTNTKAEALDVKVSVEADSPEPLPWVTLSGPELRSIGPKEVQTVEVVLAPPADHGEDVISVKVAVVSTRKPELDWATSPGLRVQVSRSGPPAPPRRWWPWAAAALALALVVAGAIYWVGDRRGALGAACRSDAGCLETLVCTSIGARGLCLGRDGTSCASDGQCASARCVNGACTSAPPPPPDPAIAAIRRLWVELPASPARGCELDYDFQPPGILGLYCRVAGIMDYATLRARLSLPIYTNSVHSPTQLSRGVSQDFGRYNPAFVDWIVANGVPGAEDPQLRAASQPVYDGRVRPAARLFYYAKRLLDDSGRRAEYLAAYSAAISSPTSPASGPGSNPSALIPRELHEEPYWRITEIAMRFWMRRALDGTEAKFAAGLEKVLTTYDAAWLAEARQVPVDAMPARATQWFIHPQ